MSLRWRDLSGGSTIAVVLALGLFASPLAAQKTNLTVTGGSITFPTPTVADYINGYVDAAAGVTFTIAAQTGSSRTTTVSVRSTSANLGGGKLIGDLQWRRADLATWNSISLTDAQIEQRTLVRNSLNDPWSNTIFFRMVLSWATDAPGTYNGNYVITLSQTVP
ncbi:MAG TPA: hypothetical protein VHL12_04690 [Gemmatimonadaceae bacterium]|jgi:hypothetical protein|nr:hypothetical protein [Gemmatimonadaceae bacterium]